MYSSICPGKFASKIHPVQHILHQTFSEVPLQDIFLQEKTLPLVPENSPHQSSETFLPKKTGPPNSHRKSNPDQAQNGKSTEKKLVFVLLQFSKNIKLIDFKCSDSMFQLKSENNIRIINRRQKYLEKN